jgi:hypothetical protein
LSVVGPLRLLRTIAAVAILATAEAACDRGPKIGPPDHLSKVGDGQTAEVGTAVGTTPSVVILDANDRGVPGVAVMFTVTSGGGTIETPSATTDQSGTASAGAWTLGGVAGVQSLRATVPGVTGSPTTFTATATAGAAVSLTKVGAEPATSPAGSSIDSIVVIAKDKFGNAVSGQAIVFTVTAGGGSISPASRTTLADGRAAARWTVGPDVEVQNTATAALSNGSLAVQFSLLSTRPIAAVRFTEHVLVVDSGQTINPAISLVDSTGGSVSGASAALTTRDVLVATAGSGSVTGSKSGQTFLIATSVDNQNARDSAVVLVGGGGKPVVFLTMPRFDLKADTTFTVSLFVDSRSPTAIGAATLQVVWDPAVVALLSDQPGSTTALVAVNATGAASGGATIAMISSGGVTGAIEVRRLTFKASGVAGRTGSISVHVADMAAATTFANLAPVTVSGSYPVRIR